METVQGGVIHYGVKETLVVNGNGEMVMVKSYKREFYTDPTF